MTTFHYFCDSFCHHLIFVNHPNYQLLFEVNQLFNCFNVSKIILKGIGYVMIDSKTCPTSRCLFAQLPDARRNFGDFEPPSEAETALK